MPQELSDWSKKQIIWIKRIMILNLFLIVPGLVCTSNLFFSSTWYWKLWTTVLLGLFAQAILGIIGLITTRRYMLFSMALLYATTGMGGFIMLGLIGSR